MRRMTRLLATVAVFTVLATGCFGDDGGDATPGPSVADDATADDGVGGDVGVVDPGDGVDDCGQGQAWPDDPDFREAVCRPFMAMLELMGGDVSGVPVWSERISAAILGYADDRAGSMAELNAVTAEIEAAVG
ncbi:MAG: hypothetical protein DHS20C19_01320 [Acidimicrobiales bacterium]|nr:MAG: hypothetical protein DHS20C19_01320 [Acidimicrobiales bacterium]